MLGINGKQLTDKEFYGYYQDILTSKINNTFDKNDILYFVTYQPKGQQLDYNQLSTATHQLFKAFKYVEVLEQNFHHSNVYDAGRYTNGYHSHIIIRKKDYDTIKHNLFGIDIVANMVYDIHNLVFKYLSKQAIHNQILPISHIPKLTPTLESQTHIHTCNQLKTIINTKREYVVNIEISYVKTAKFNKIDVFYRYVNDT